MVENPSRVFSKGASAEPPSNAPAGGPSEAGMFTVPCVVPRLSATPGEARSAGPAPGAHNAEVYGGWLGLSAAEQAALELV